jgi:hypothetical protein
MAIHRTGRGCQHPVAGLSSGPLGASPSGKAPDFGSGIAGSNPAAPASLSASRFRHPPESIGKTTAQATGLPPLGGDAAEGQSLGDVSAGDLGDAVQVGDGARDSQQPVAAIWLVGEPQATMKSDTS